MSKGQVVEYGPAHQVFAPRSTPTRRRCSRRRRARTSRSAGVSALYGALSALFVARTVNVLAHGAAQVGRLQTA
jgi:hypothetical protein